MRKRFDKLVNHGLGEGASGGCNLISILHHGVTRLVSVGPSSERILYVVLLVGNPVVAENAFRGLPPGRS